MIFLFWTSSEFGGFNCLVSSAQVTFVGEICDLEVSKNNAIHDLWMMFPSRKCFGSFVVIPFVFCLSLCSTVEVGSHRDKRMIWGTPLSYTKAYTVTNYFALLTKGSRFSYVVAKATELLTGTLPKPNLRSIQCGGALITKTVVQTACHCFGNYIRVNDSYSKAHVVNGWENWSSVFVGYTVVTQMVEDGLWSKKFIVHQKCANLMLQLGDSLTHDYSLVVMNKEVNFRLINQAVAPVYSSESLSNIYYQIMRQEAVCLHVGFGSFYFKKPGIKATGSPVLQHGWRVIRPYWYCYWRNYLHSSRHHFREFGMSYPLVATWICTQYFGKERGTPWGGDSGSPVTCNDIYVGMISFKDVLYKTTNVSTDFFGALAFSQYENAADYRKSLIAKISDYSKLKEWPPDKPVNIEARNDWGLYFQPPDVTSGGLYILKRFDEKGELESKTDNSVSISKSIRMSRSGWVAFLISLKFFHILSFIL